MSMAGAVVACLLVAGAATAGQRSEMSPSGAAPDTLIYAGAADPTYLDPALVSDGESFRVTKQIYESLVDFAPGTTRLVPALATSWSVAQGRTDVHVQPARRSPLPRRHQVQRGRRVRELQPLVQLQRPVPGRVGDLLLPGDLPGLQAQRERLARQAALPELPRGRPAEGRHQADAEERPVRSFTRPLGVLDPEPDRDGEVGREPGHDPQRRLRADRERMRSSIRPARARTGSSAGRSASRSSCARTRPTGTRSSRGSRGSSSARSATTRPACRRSRPVRSSGWTCSLHSSSRRCGATRT